MPALQQRGKLTDGDEWKNKEMTLRQAGRHAVQKGRREQQRENYRLRIRHPDFPLQGANYANLLLMPYMGAWSGVYISYPIGGE